MAELSERTRTLIQLAVEEDLGTPGDITSQACIPDDTLGSAQVVAREEIRVCGQQLAEAVFLAVGPELQYQILVDDGGKSEAGAIIARVSGRLRGILAGERTALNFLQRLSGIATLTSQVVSLLGDNPIKLLDTRKTTPAWRELEKYAVSVGGGVNHRVGLYDAVLIKDNHIDALGGDVSLAIERCREYAGSDVKVEVEVRDVEELKSAIQAQPDSILLDNMTPKALSHAVQIVRAHPLGKHLELEASGGIGLDTLDQYAQSGIDAVSMGRLTHSATAVDIALDYQKK